MSNKRQTVADAVAQGEQQIEDKNDPGLKVGSIVVVGTARGSVVCKVKKLTRRDIVLRPITRVRK